MTNTRVTIAAMLLAATWFVPYGARASDHYYCSGLPGCTFDKVAVIRCETNSDGQIVVRNSSVTTATGVTVQKGARCASTISALLQAGLRMAHGPHVTPSSTGPEVSFNFVFVPDYYGDDDSDDDDDDDDDSDDDD